MAEPSAKSVCKPVVAHIQMLDCEGVVRGAIRVLLNEDDVYEPSVASDRCPHCGMGTMQSMFDGGLECSDCGYQT